MKQDHTVLAGKPSNYCLEMTLELERERYAGTRHRAKHEKSAAGHAHREYNGVEKGRAQGPAYGRRVK